MKPQEYIAPLNMNGLTGRMLYMPAPKGKKRVQLLLYGHHSSLERMFGIAEVFNDYGSVTIPDWPGFGGMDSFYKIGMKPTLDNLADYLASFIKLRFKNQKITIVGMSFGFLVATRMLQNYPRLVKNVDILVSAVGFCHKDDFAFTKTRYQAYLAMSRFFGLPGASGFFKNVVLHPTVLRTFYGKTHNAKNKFKNLSAEDAKRAMDFEVYLWRCNEVRTYMNTSVTMLTIDNCKKQINLPVHHIAVAADQYFNNSNVEQHMRVVFNDFIVHKADSKVHAPSIIANKKDAAIFVPKSIQQLLARNPS